MEIVLSRLHQQLEARVRDLKYLHDYSNIVKEVGGDPDNLDAETLELIRAEIRTFQFTIRKNELHSMFSWTDENGMLVQEPDVKDFSDQQLEYLAGRQRDSKDMILKARYSHILWHSRARKIDHARNVIYAYLDLWQMVNNFLNGGDSINVFCRQHNIKLNVVGAGVNYDFPKSLPGLIWNKAAKSTENFLKTSAMTVKQAQSCKASSHL